jgi:hypothetical protein
MTNRRTVGEVVDIIKNVAEIVAIVVAGTWAFWMYVLKDRPALQPKANADVDIKWASLSSRCIASATLSLENTGNSAIVIRPPTAKAFIVSSSAFPDADAAPLDWPAMLRSTKGVVPLPGIAPAAMNAFARRYEPGQSHWDTFEWVLHRPKNATDEAWLYVSLVATDKSGKEFSYSKWTQVCGGQSS